MSTKNQKKARRQFNTRIPASLWEAATEVTEALGWSKNDMGQVALACLLGSQDEIITAKARKALSVAKNLNLSFNHADRQSGSLPTAA